MKVITLITRRPEMTREQFRAYYEDHHAPLGTRYFPFEKYVRNHVVGSIPDPVGFDCLMECWVDREAALVSLDGPLGKLFAEDEARFMVARGIGVDVVEHLISGPPRGVDPRGLQKTAYFLRKSLEISQSDFLERAGDLGKGLGAGGPGPSGLGAGGLAERITLDEVLPGHSAPGFTADAVLTFWMSGGFGRVSIPVPTGVSVQATIGLNSYETTPDELAAAFGT